MNSRDAKLMRELLNPELVRAAQQYSGRRWENIAPMLDDIFHPPWYVRLWRRMRGAA